MQLNLLLNILFVGYFIENGDCGGDEKVHIKIHVPVKYHKHTEYLGGPGKKHMVLHKHHHKHGHKHNHGHKHGHKHGHDHKHKHGEKHGHKHEHKHEGKHEHKHGHQHEGKHEHKHDQKHEHNHVGVHGHKHHHDHKEDGKHHHKHSHKGQNKHKHHHKHSHKGKHHDDHKNIIIEPVLYNQDDSGESFKDRQVETFSRPYVIPHEQLSEEYSNEKSEIDEDSSSFTVTASYKVQEYDPFDTTTKVIGNQVTTTPNPFDLADQIFDVNDSLEMGDFHEQGENDSNEEEPLNEEYAEDSDGGSSEELQEGTEHPQHIQDYIDNSTGDLENYVDYDYTAPKIQYAEKVVLPDGKYKWNGGELDKYLEQTYGTEHREGEYDKYLDEASTKIEHKATPNPLFLRKASRPDINPNVAPVTFPTTESDFLDIKFR